MLETNPETTVKRYAPPSQRNRSLNRRKSGGGDKLEKISYSYGVNGEKGQASYLKNFPPIDHGEASGTVGNSEAVYPRLIPLDGCCTSEAAQLLTDRWAAAMHSYNDSSKGPSERLVIYSGASRSSGEHLKLPRQMDFLGELRRAMHTVPTSRS